MDTEISRDASPELVRKKKNDKGFTLIELLIVIVILGVLSTIVVLSVGGITDKGKKSACKSDYNALATAVETYNAQNGTYPADQTALVTGGFLRTKSQNYDIAVGAASHGGGDLDPVAAGPGACTYDPDETPPVLN